MKPSSRYLSVALMSIAMAWAASAWAMDHEAEEAAIRAVDARWSQALYDRDLDGVMENYADDAAFLAANQPTIVGKQAIREWFAQRIATPGYRASFQPTRIVVSDSLETAYEIGTYQASWTAADGQTMAGVGKHLVVWEKREGVWRVAAESISPDGPAVPAPK
jgi:uncharacterized protein (TIGR02246 family)